VNTEAGDIVIVVFLRGGRPTYGPRLRRLPGRCIAFVRSQLLRGQGDCAEDSEAAQTIEAPDATEAKDPQ